MSFNLKRAYALALCLILALSFTGCGTNKQTYESKELDLILTLNKGTSVTEEENSIVLNLADNVKALIYVSDVSSSIDKDTLTLFSPEECDLRGGGFEHNFNNILFVREYFNTIMSGSENGYEIYGVGESSFSGYDAYKANFSDEKDSVNGYIYMSVKGARCYLIIVYILDSAQNIHSYDEAVDPFIAGITITR